MKPAMCVMLKPASGLCNMKCKYCFYADETGKRSVADYGIMSEPTLKNVLKKALEAASQGCTIMFQGGEPTLAGLDFFKRAVELSGELNVNHCRVDFAIQTNGLLIDDEWCEFFKKNNFLVGISVDGTKQIHDENRVDKNGRGTHSRVMQSVSLLKKHGVETNALTVVTANTARHYKQIYNYFTAEGLDYQQYIPCLEPLGEARGNSPWSLSPKRFEQYLKASFDCWYGDFMSGKRRYHRYFDNLLLMLNGQPPEACGMCGACSAQYVVESNGNVYPCDFYMLDEYLIGNLNTDTLDEIDENRKKSGFIEQSEAPDNDCLSCKWLKLCRGGCRRDRDYFEQGIGKNYYCSAYKAFFDYAYPRLVQAYNILMHT